MARIVLVLVALAAGSTVGAALFAHGSQAAPREVVAAIQRTFVSTAGNDANACTRAEPCRNFQAAIANTLAGGEVVALDSGGYGVFSIDKSITIAGAPGAHVAVTAFAGTGITVNIAAADTVVLRNLYVTGLGGDRGILFQAGGRLFVESVVASGFAQRGLYATADNGELFVRDSVFRNNNLQGLFVEGSLRVEIADSRADRNDTAGFGLSISARGSITNSAATRNGTYGFLFSSGAVFAVSDSLADGNSRGVGVLASGTQVTLSDVGLCNNADYALFIAAGTPVARIGGSTVTGNGVGLSKVEGTLETFGDNMVRGNTTDTDGTITTVGKT